MHKSHSHISSPGPLGAICRVIASWALLLMIVCLLCPGARAQGIITTVAGNGVAGYSGDGGPAVNAQFRELLGLAVDAAGNLYAADCWNHCIRRITPAGIVTTVAGTGEAGFSGDGGPATAARLYNPSGVTVDTSGNLYIADQSNYRVRKVDPTGVISTVAGDGARGYPAEGGQATAGPLDTPEGMAVDSAGNLYFADQGNHVVWKLTPGGVLIKVAGGNGGGYSGDGGLALDGQLYYPFDVKVDGAGNIYIADDWNHRIRKVAGNGIITTIAGNGSAGYAGDNGLAINAQLYYPSWIGLDSAGSLYVADGWNHRVRKITPDGIITTVAGNGTYGFSGDGGPATVASLTYATGVVVNAGRLYFGDLYNWRIRMVTGLGQILPSLGPGRLWIGLKNSDDQGTQFDIKLEVYKNQTTLLSTGEALCVTGVTRNPSLAKQVGIAFGPMVQESLNTGDQLSLRILTRIGTNPNGTKCSGPGGSHNSAVGLRLYYDAANQPSRFAAEMPPDPPSGFFLHFPDFFDNVAPTASTAKYKDSSGVNFAGGNTWKEIGTWSMPVQ